MQKFHQYIADAYNLDLFDLNYVYSSNIFKRFLEYSKKALPKKGLFFRFCAFFLHFFEQFKPFKWKKERLTKPPKYLFFAGTKNQMDSLSPIVQCTINSMLFGNPTENSFHFVTFLGYLYSLPFFCKTVIKYLQSKDIKRLSFHYNFDRYWFTYGYYIAVKNWLSKMKPEMLIFSNDHNIENRVFRKISQDIHITTGYIQHASITNEFPVLEFDYAFLEGRDALDNYSNIGNTKTITFLVGSPKFDGFQNFINKSETIDSIGICINSFDTFESISNILIFLHASCPEKKIILRPHPGEKRMPEWNKLADERQIVFSNSKEEKSFDFLSHVDCVIAGNSNILLEAALLNVYPILFDFAKKPALIKYSFIEKGLCEYVSSEKKLLELISTISNKKECVRTRAKYYIDTIDTPYDGNSSQLVKELIIELSENKKIDLSKWHRIPDNRIEAYSINPQ
jgi:hypothetical protein